jgi:glyoxylase-like metal-dependent hydrolase (beta-lactamase superfamily II)
VDDWREVGPGILVRRYAFFDQNIGIVIGDGALLVVDTRSSERQARELQGEIRRVSAHPWIVVNTHHHFDHTFGNGAFAGVEIWGHELCTVAMHEFGETARHRVAGDLPDLAEELAEVTITVPTRTFADRAMLDVGGREVTLHHLGRGHTDNDIVVAVPDAQVVFAGDLIEQGAPPYFGDSYPLDWPTSNTRMLELIEGPVVPGHGDVVDADFVRRQTADLASAGDVARRAHAAGEPAEAALASMPFPDPHSRECLLRAYAQLDAEAPLPRAGRSLD